MRVENYTDHHKKTLTEQMAAARAAVQAQTARAHDLAKDLPPTGDPTPAMALWNKAGYYAGIGCLWFAFVAPILLVLENWD